MSVGKSHRIVIEVDKEFKEMMYKVLGEKNTTLRDWFINKVESDLFGELVKGEEKDG